jgi:hypothetical protein
MIACECADVGDRLIESVGLLHSITLSLSIGSFEPLVYELERLKFNEYLATVKSLWARFVLVVQEAHDATQIRFDAVSRSLGAIAPL